MWVGSQAIEWLFSIAGYCILYLCRVSHTVAWISMTFTGLIQRNIKGLLIRNANHLVQLHSTCDGHPYRPTHHPSNRKGLPPNSAICRLRFHLSHRNVCPSIGLILQWLSVINTAEQKTSRKGKTCLIMEHQQQQVFRGGMLRIRKQTKPSTNCKTFDVITPLEDLKQ